MCIRDRRIAQVSFDRLPAMLSVGDIAEITVQLPTVSKARVIPGAALRHQGARTGVWKLVDGGLHSPR